MRMQIADAEPTQQQLLAGWITTTVFEAAGLFSGAVVIGLSRALERPFLGLVGLGIWFLALWAENYSVSDIAKPAFGLSKPVSIFVMSIAEFATWTIWLLLTGTGLHWLVLLVALLLLTQVHHAVQFCFFFPSSTIGVGLRHPLLWLASAVEAVAGQALIRPLVDGTQHDDRTFGLILGGLLVLFAVEHLIGGRVRPDS